MKPKHVTMMAGSAARNASLYRRLGLSLADPAAWIEIDSRRFAIVRDLEMERVAQAGRVDEVTCPAEHAPPVGLDPDRETATAQAAAQFLRHHRAERVTVDRTLPMIYAWHLQQAEIDMDYEPQLGVIDRRPKSASEIRQLADAQQITEGVMRSVCERIAGASVDDEGRLIDGSQPLTSDRLRSYAAVEFLAHRCSMPQGAIIASLPDVADCHHPGSGVLRSGTPVIVDLFPFHEPTRMWGDCTRTVVHGHASDTVNKMHLAVTQAKAAAIAAMAPEVTGERLHRTATDVLIGHGFRLSRGSISDDPTVQHGTGHGIGLDLHEPILLDEGGGEVLEHEVFTVEPGLYGRRDGGVRVEDMVVVTDQGPSNLNRLHEGLDWG